MKEIKRVDLKALAKTGILIGIGISLFWMGVVFPLIGLLVFKIQLQMFLTFWANMIILAVICGLLVGIHFLIAGLIYNLVAKKIGGIKLEIK